MNRTYIEQNRVIRSKASNFYCVYTVIVLVGYTYLRTILYTVPSSLFNFRLLLPVTISTFHDFFTRFELKVARISRLQQPHHNIVICQSQSIYIP